MNIWLDDVRDPPAIGGPWTVVRTADEAIALLDAGDVEFASLDHDLTPAQTLPPDGTIKDDGEKSGHDVVLWPERNPHRWPVCGVEVHSQNPAGLRRMLEVVERNGGMKRRADAGTDRHP